MVVSVGILISLHARRLNLGLDRTDGRSAEQRMQLERLAGTRAGGFVLTRQEPVGKWGAATYALRRRPATFSISARPQCRKPADRTKIEPDVRIARIRLSDKNSRLHPRHVVPKSAQAYELPRDDTSHRSSWEDA
jgi:hypothetical protein